jgi:hypothetical protein
MSIRFGSLKTLPAAAGWVFKKNRVSLYMPYPFSGICDTFEKTNNGGYAGMR